MFDNFERQRITTRETDINCVIGGSGSPVLLLHGYPETHACWHRIASTLAESFTVICTDLRGYGDSGKPPSDPKHIAYSKRTMADDQVEVMRSLGFDEFAVVGHDRGARVAHRMALDHGHEVTKLALLDIVPTKTALDNVNREMATAAFNWFFMIQPDGLPERLIGAEAMFYLHWILDHWAASKNALDPEAVVEYERCFDAEMIRATCDEYRASVTVDLAHDEADKDKRIACPTLVLWSGQSMWSKYDIVGIWRSKADNVQGTALDCGHFLPEEAPELTATHLIKFLSDNETQEISGHRIS